jgi:HSP20 family protein
MARDRGEQSEARNAQGQQSQRGQQMGASAGSSSTSDAAARNENRPAEAAGEQGRTGRDSGRESRADAERPIPVSGEGGRMQRTEPGRGQNAVARRQNMGGPMIFRGGFPPTPWELMRRMAEEMTQLIDGVGDARTGAPGMGQRQSGLATTSQAGAAASGLTAGGTAAWVPQIDVVHRADAVVVRADLPGIPPDDIVITVEDGLLAIAGERQEERKENDQGLVRNELVYGRFYRAIPLPDGADENRVTATFRNGVLEITVPVAEREQGRRVRVQSYPGVPNRARKLDERID